MDAPGLPCAHFRDGMKEQIAPVHPDFACGFVPLSLMGLAGWLPIAMTHSRCSSHFGFGQPRSELFAIIRVSALAIGGSNLLHFDRSLAFVGCGNAVASRGT